jgi:hypothetical protein
MGEIIPLVNFGENLQASDCFKYHSNQAAKFYRVNLKIATFLRTILKKLKDDGGP